MSQQPQDKVERKQIIMFQRVKKSSNTISHAAVSNTDCLNSFIMVSSFVYGLNKNFFEDGCLLGCSTV
jgi:hypothetical protein